MDISTDRLKCYYCGLLDAKEPWIDSAGIGHMSVCNSEDCHEDDIKDAWWQRTARTKHDKR